MADFPTSRERIIEDMKICEQTKHVNVLEHGRMVNNHYKDLICHLIKGTKLSLAWKLPQWIYDYKRVILDNLFESEIMGRYQIYHDCDYAAKTIL